MLKLISIILAKYKIDSNAGNMWKSNIRAHHRNGSLIQGPTDQNRPRKVRKSRTGPEPTKFSKCPDKSDRSVPALILIFRVGFET